MPTKTKNNIVLFIALLFHVCGIIGILCTPYKNWFIQNTPVNLLLMCALLIWTQTEKNLSFFIFFMICFATGLLTEVLGVNTGLLFGRYTYSNILGVQLLHVPLMIGINWFIVVYCAGIIVEKFDKYLLKKMGNEELFSSRMLTISFVIDAALLATFFDWIIEPGAVKIGLWKWLGDGEIPLFNYSCWFIISTVLLIVFRRLKFNKDNHFAVHLFIIQLLFFIALRTIL